MTFENAEKPRFIVTNLPIVNDISDINNHGLSEIYKVEVGRVCICVRFISHICVFESNTGPIVLHALLQSFDGCIIPYTSVVTRGYVYDVNDYGVVFLEALLFTGIILLTLRNVSEGLIVRATLIAQELWFVATENLMIR